MEKTDSNHNKVTTDLLYGWVRLIIKEGHFHENQNGKDGQ